MATFSECTSLSLKTNYLGDLRRFELNCAKELNVDCIKSKVCSLYGIEEMSFDLKYVDDEGDKVSIHTNEDIHEAVAFAQNSILRLFVSSNGALIPNRQEVTAEGGTVFLHHITVPDDSFVEANTTFTKAC
jgi:hypothetical protein